MPTPPSSPACPIALNTCDDFLADPFIRSSFIRSFIRLFIRSSFIRLMIWSLIWSVPCHHVYCSVQRSSTGPICTKLYNYQLPFN